MSNTNEFFKEKEPYIFKETNACPYLSKSTSKWLMYLDGEDHLKARELVEKGLVVFNYDELTNQAIDEILVELKEAHIDVIAMKSGLSTSQLNVLLFQLEMKNVVHSSSGNRYTLQWKHCA